VNNEITEYSILSITYRTIAWSTDEFRIKGESLILCLISLLIRQCWPVAGSTAAWRLSREHRIWTHCCLHH